MLLNVLFDSLLHFYLTPFLLTYPTKYKPNKLQMNALVSEYMNEYFCEHCAIRYYVSLLCVFTTEPHSFSQTWKEYLLRACCSSDREHGSSFNPHVFRLELVIFMWFLMLEKISSKE